MPALNTNLYGQKKCGCWQNDRGDTYNFAEQLALAEFKRRGFSGTWCEGVTLTLLMKAACFPLLIKHHPELERHIVARRAFYFLCRDMTTVSPKEIEETVLSTSFPSIRDITREILSRGDTRRNIKRQSFHSDVGVSNVTELWECLGKELLSKVAAKFFLDPQTYKDGWPDLTLTRRGQAQFVEVKTTDLTTRHQRIIRQQFAEPLALPFSVVTVGSR